MLNPLLDKNFLKQLDQHNNKTVYIRIIALNQEEIPVEQIEGKATGGNINIQGNSAVRRTCSITLTALNTEAEITDVYWAFKNKFKLEIGLKNEINSNYPDIVWFKQGIFVVNNFSKSRSTTNLNISISGQDKMCLLNGTLGGTLPHETDFGTIETEDENGNIIIEKITIYDIVRNAMLMYGQERPENIIINDLDEVAYELLEYRGDTPMYLFLNTDDVKKVQNICFETNSLINDVEKFYALNTLDNSYNDEATILEDYNNTYVAKIEYGETAGYHQISLVYNDDLILKVGEPITSMLDKIKNMLGNYEYFYDIDGRFIFQKKKTYVQELFNPVNGELNIPLAMATPYSYCFDDYKLFTAISNSPKVNNIKNDYSIWGTRKSISGSNLPIHVRYAIDDKPISYISPYDSYIKVNNLYYIVPTEITQEDWVSGSIVWKEVTNGYVETSATENYQSGYYTLLQTKEYPLVQKLDDNKEPMLNEDGSYIMIPEDIANVRICYKTSPTSYRYLNTISEEERNKYVIFQGQNVIPKYKPLNDTNPLYGFNSDRTLVEINNIQRIYKKIDKSERKYYSDYREIIYQMAYDYYQYGNEENYIRDISEKNHDLINNGKTGYEPYYADIQGFWRQLYNPDTIYDELTGQEFYDEYGYDNEGTKAFWNKKIHTDPNSLVFWFELLDLNNYNDYSVKKIGLRTKTDNQNTTTGIFYKDTPEAVFLYGKEEWKSDDTSYTPLRLNQNMEELFSRSAQGVSAIQRFNDLLYQHTSLGETLSITSIPIYYLQPNTRIYVEGEGDCTLDSITYQLTHNGTMSLNCTKIIEPFNI